MLCCAAGIAPWQAQLYEKADFHLVWPACVGLLLEALLGLLAGRVVLVGQIP